MIKRIACWCLGIGMVVSAGACSIREEAPFQWPDLEIGIARNVPAYDYPVKKLAELPRYNAQNQSTWQVDIRSADIADLDLSGRLEDLLHCHFDTRTVWPNSLPEGFDPLAVLELGKNPGLGVRTLHARGITGQGVAIGIVDEYLLTDHIEYKDNLVHYEEAFPGETGSGNHGPMVASLAVGKNVGVAPEAKLYYIAAPNRHSPGDSTLTSIYCANAVERLTQISQTLPDAEKIRVISLSWDLSSGVDGLTELRKAIAGAENAGIFVVSPLLYLEGQYKFYGLNKTPMGDPDDYRSYSLKGMSTDMLSQITDDFVLFPKDARAYASFMDAEGYSWGANNGISLTIPYVAGLYALSCQIDPTITPARFWDALANTSITAQEVGRIADPVAMADLLQSGK